LYRDDSFSVTPSWLSVGNTRYAIRTITRLDYDTIRPNLNVPYLFFFGAIVLMAYSLYQFTRPSVPAYVPWLMLIGSVSIFLYAAWNAFRTGPHYRLSVTLLDGEKIPLTTEDVDQAQGLLDGLTEAMDWHRNGDVLIDAERVSHVKQGRVAARLVGGRSSSRGGSSADTNDKADSGDDRALPNIPPIILSLLRGRD